MSGFPLPPEVEALLRCPRCGATVAIEENVVRCSAQHEFSTDAGVINFLIEPADSDLKKTFESFGYEWTTFPRIQPEDEVFWQSYFRDVPLDELQNAVALDAGCGKGRFTRFTASHVREIVAFDPSDAILSAVSNLSDVTNATFIRGDLLNPPFGPASFGFISCLGVLHHLPDPQRGLTSLVELLQPGGSMLLYVYSRPTKRGVRAMALAVATALRRATVVLPRRAVRLLSAPLAAFLYVTFVVPGWIGDRFTLRRLGELPLATYRGRPVRSLWLDTFDRLSAPLEHRYTSSELRTALLRAGLQIEKIREDAGWFVVARRAGNV
ncbi:MAG: class I SAM-dependent methyltransferase [Actinomycetota bacterium]|nr:class I SAM-dependent methyltransferase [Actinomycetota bacterium]